MRDLYMKQANNRLVLLPDWRVRSDDKLPQLEIFTGDLRIKKKSQQPFEGKKLNIETQLLPDYTTSCIEEPIRKYVNQQIKNKNKNFHVSASLKVPRSRVSSFQIKGNEESYFAKMSRISAEKYM